MGANQSLEIILLTGQKKAGKTTWLGKNMSSSSGFLSPIIFQRRHFRLIPHEITFPMEEKDGELKVGKYTFSPKAFKKVEQHVRESFASEEMIFDEIGPLEIRGEGFSDLLKFTLSNYSGRLIIVLRSEIIEEAIEAFRLDYFPLSVVDFEELKTSGINQLPY